MRRRQALGILASIPAWPRESASQQGIPTVGVLVLTDPGGFSALLKAGLREAGYLTDQQLRIEIRSADDDPARLPSLAAELVQLNVDVLVAYPTPAALAAKRATAHIPIVIVAPDPVADGLIATLGRPGGNITGVSLSTAQLSAKSLDLVREMLPTAARVGVLASGTDPFTTTFLRELQAAATAARIEVVTSMVHTREAIGEGIAALKQARADAVLVQGSLVSAASAAEVLKQGLPAVSARKTFAVAGGLMSYGADLNDTFRNAAIYVAKILKGAKPADMPVEQPTKFELVINLRTAKTLGISIPPTLLARADEVIE
jgi:putative ABC transport system substrate-binding protein